MDLFEQTKMEVERNLPKEENSHDWDHVQRVYELCMRIGEKESAELEILGLAAILHDVGRRDQDKSKGRVCHAKKGAILARELLEKHGVDEDTINQVLHCIRTHRFRGDEVPKSKEAKILFDADKLDSIGAIGVARAFLFAGEIGAKLHDSEEIDLKKAKPYTRGDTAYREFLVKLQRIKDKMCTSEGKRIATERHRFMLAFFDRLNREVEGEL